LSALIDRCYDVHVTQVLTGGWWLLHALPLKKWGFTAFTYTAYIQAQIQQTLTRQALSSIHWHATGTE